MTLLLLLLLLLISLRLGKWLLLILWLLLLLLMLLLLMLILLLLLQLLLRLLRRRLQLGDCDVLQPLAHANRLQVPHPPLLKRHIFLADLQQALQLRVGLPQR